MRLDIRCIVEMSPEVRRNFDALSNTMDLILERMNAMSAELDALTAQVKANSSLLDSATTLINGIAARITAAGTDPVALKALTDELKAKDDALAAAIAANTPAAP